MKAWRWAILFGTVAWTLGATVASADTIVDVDKNAARQFATEGVARYQQGDWKGAWDLFHRANELVKAPTLAVWEARALDKLGALVAAEERYLEAMRAPLGPDTPPAFGQAIAEAAEELKRLRPRIPSVQINVIGEGENAPGLTVKRNGEVVAPPLLGVRHSLNPGRLEIVATAPNMKPTRVLLTLVEGAREVVTLSVQPLLRAESIMARPHARTGDADAEGTPTARTLGWVSLGVGTAGLGLGVVTGVMAAREHSKAEDACTKDVCVEGDAGSDSVDTFRSLRTVSTVGYAVGVLGAGVGTYLLLATTDTQATARGAIRPWVGLGSAGVFGVF